MVREIKFRAWDTKKERMMYYPFGVGLTMLPGDKETICFQGDSVQVHPQSELYKVTQFTGLKDKNGKEIYEGDIIEQTFFGDDVSKTIIIVKDVVFDNSILYPGSSKENEVIGNVYENPELIKQPM